MIANLSVFFFPKSVSLLFRVSKSGRNSLQIKGMYVTIIYLNYVNLNAVWMVLGGSMSLMISEIDDSSIGSSKEPWNYIATASTGLISSMNVVQGSTFGVDELRNMLFSSSAAQTSTFCPSK